jgi:hypothetical protein
LTSLIDTSAHSGSESPSYKRGLGRLMLRVKRRIYKSSRRRAQRFLQRYEPRLLECSSTFRRLSGQDFPFQPERARLLISLLERKRPRVVLELGSGTSTAWFAAYARKHAAKVISIDQNREWLNAAAAAAAEIGPVETVFAPVVAEAGGARYDLSLPDADFVYLDGPSPRGLSPAPGAGVVYQDVPNLLRRGGRPDVIVVDSRGATIDYMRRQGLLSDYVHLPEFKYCLERRKWLQALRFRRQSILLKR